MWNKGFFHGEGAIRKTNDSMELSGRLQTSWRLLLWEKGGGKIVNRPLQREREEERAGVGSNH